MCGRKFKRRQTAQAGTCDRMTQRRTKVSQGNRATAAQQVHNECGPAMFRGPMRMAHSTHSKQTGSIQNRCSCKQPSIPLRLSPHHHSKVSQTALCRHIPSQKPAVAATTSTIDAACTTTNQPNHSLTAFRHASSQHTYQGTHHTSLTTSNMCCYCRSHGCFSG
jgi:hypothetical protein